MIVAEMQHDDISEIVAKKFRREGYRVAFSNMTSAYNGEQPDALGITICGTSTILAEVKTSRSDFRADSKKIWRQNGIGIGKRRIYVTTKELLQPEEIPYGWELWEVHGTNKPIIKVIKGKVLKEEHVEWRKGKVKVPYYLNCDEKEYIHFRDTNDQGQVVGWLCKIMDRIQGDDIDISKYANGKYCGGISLS